MFRCQRKREGGALKYVYVTEGKHGDKRYHHHLVINASGAADLETICSLWKYGDIVDVERIADRLHMDVVRYIHFGNCGYRNICNAQSSTNISGGKAASTLSSDHLPILMLYGWFHLIWRMSQ